MKDGTLSASHLAKRGTIQRLCLMKQLSNFTLECRLQVLEPGITFSIVANQIWMGWLPIKRLWITFGPFEEFKALMNIMLESIDIRNIRIHRNICDFKGQKFPPMSLSSVDLWKLLNPPQLGLRVLGLNSKIGLANKVLANI